MTAAEREAWLDHLCQSGDPPEEEDEFEDVEPLTGEELEEVRAAAADELLAAEAAMTGRRGPGMAGSARVFPGESASPAASFGPGMVLDVMPGCAGLAVAADAAAGDEDSFAGVSDAELLGVVCAWDRVEAHAAARKLAAIAEVYRRRPEPGCGTHGPARMPIACEEFAAAELAAGLGESRARAEDLLGCAWELETRLPGTAAALRDGTISWSKAGIIMRAAQFLDAAEAAAAEGKVLGRAGRLTPGSLRAAIAHAVMEVAPGKARKRREAAARDGRGERGAEDSGNAALLGRELPPDEVLAADQKITWWAGELKKAGLDSDMDVLRARAFLDLLLGKDSRPRPGTTGGDGAAPDRAHGAGPDSPASPGNPGDSVGPHGSGGPDQPGAAGPGAGPGSAGFAARVNLTVPLATAAGLATLRDCTGEVYARVDEAAAAVAKLASDALAAEGVPFRLQEAGSLFSVFLGLDTPVRDFGEARGQSAPAYAAFFHAMLDQGVYLPPSPYEAWFLSAAHDDEAVSRVASALPAAARAAAAAVG